MVPILLLGDVFNTNVKNQVRNVTIRQFDGEFFSVHILIIKEIN